MDLPLLPVLVDWRVENMRASFRDLSNTVRTALRIHIGDRHRLNTVCEEVILLSETVEQHRHIFEGEEYNVFCDSFATMLEALDDASQRALDPPDDSALVVAHYVKTGKRGRPRLEIDRDFLETATLLRGPTHLSVLFNCTARTVRRRLLDYGLAEHQEPVIRREVHEDGTVITTNTSFSAPVSSLSNHDLIEWICECLQLFPHHRISMIYGFLKSFGHNVPRARISEALRYILGTSRPFMEQRIQRRVYKVVGPNALWHHDGQHGLIKYGFITHAFVDGFSRLVIVIGVHNNNRAQTVLDLFLRGVQQLGSPKRVRGDHGTENVLVAQWMEEQHGLDRGSYIWGRSVHNNRAERLWYDVTRGYGQKWKDFFRSLEASHGLRISIPEHKWLLHYLFQHALNEDAQAWARSWNSHKLQIRGERNRSPLDMFFFGMYQEGPRGLQYMVPQPASDSIDDIDDIDDIGNIDEYGIDWDVLGDETLTTHLLANNVEENQHPSNPFSTLSSSRPAQLSSVNLDPPQGCPFDDNQLQALNDHLEAHVDSSSQSMFTRRMVWIEALVKCQELWEGFGQDAEQR